MNKHGVFVRKRKAAAVQRKLPYKPKRIRVHSVTKPKGAETGDSGAGGRSEGDNPKADEQGNASEADEQSVVEELELEDGGKPESSEADEQGNASEANEQNVQEELEGGGQPESSEADEQGDASEADEQSVQEGLEGGGQPRGDPDDDSADDSPSWDSDSDQGSDTDSSQEAEGGFGRPARTDTQRDFILGEVFVSALGPDANRITVAHVAVCLLELMKTHRASYNMMDSIYSLITQLVTPPPEASSWKRIRSLLKCSQAPVTSYMRCARDCSLTRVEDASGDCKNGHPLRPERVHVAALKPQVEAFVRTHSWADITATVTQHTVASAGSTAPCCIQCSPRYREKVLSACPPGVVTIPVILGSDGLPLTHGKFGAKRPVWLNTWRNFAVSKGSREKQWVGSLLGGPTLPPSLRTSLEPVRSELATLCNPFPCVDKDNQQRQCRLVLLGLSGDGQGLKKLSGSTWNGRWSCPTCKMPFESFLRRNITPDFRVFLPADDALRTDDRFGPACTLPRPELKTYAWHERQAGRVHDANQRLRPNQQARHSRGCRACIKITFI